MMITEHMENKGLKVDLPYTAGGPIRLAHMAGMPTVLIDTRGLQAL